MEGLIMDYQLNVPAILRRGEQLFGDREIVTRLPDRSWHRYTYAEFAPRARRLAAALRNELGLKDGDRVGTFCWNHYQHLEAYIGVPVGGMVTHTLNLRLHPDDLTYIATHAGDKVLIADKVLWPLVENFRERVGFEHVIAIGDGPTPDGAIEYEDLLASAEPDDLPEREIDERAAAAMCYTSGTTGQPKGALYSHRAIAVHSLASAMAGVLSVTEADSVLPVVPMFHANAWGFPFTCTLVGAKQVFPGPFLDGESLLEAFQQEKVTITAGVPTIWMGILAGARREPRQVRHLDRAPHGRRRLGGAAVDDRGVREAARAAHPPRVGHDRDGAARDGLRADRARAGAPRGRAVPLPRQAGHPGAVRRDARARAGGLRALGRRDDGRARGARRLDLVVPTTTRPRAPTAGPTTAGSRPATSSRSSRTATSRSRTARRIS